MTGHASDTDDELQTTTVRLQRSQYDRLREIAESNHRTVSQEMRAVFARHIADHDEPKAAA